MQVLRVFVLFAVILTAGCSSITGRTTDGFSPYVGVLASVETFERQARNIGSMLDLGVFYSLFFVDISLSAIVDTLLLPLDLWLQEEPEESSKDK